MIFIISPVDVGKIVGPTFFRDVRGEADGIVSPFVVTQMVLSFRHGTGREAWRHQVHTLGSEQGIMHTEKLWKVMHRMCAYSDYSKGDSSSALNRLDSVLAQPQALADEHRQKVRTDENYHC